MMKSKWSIACLLSIHAILLGWLGWTTSSNRTELAHMASTAYFWKTSRFDVFHVNPPLTRMVTSVPVAINRPNYDWRRYSARSRDRCEHSLGRAFIAANNPETIRRCFALARASLIPLLLLGGYFGYRLSREIYGNSSALVFLILWCFSPCLLAWGATICPDAVAAALGLVAVYSFRQWLQKSNWRRATVAGGCLGLLPLTKLTWILAFGIWPLMWCLWTLPGTLSRLAPTRKVSEDGRTTTSVLARLSGWWAAKPNVSVPARDGMARTDDRPRPRPPFRQLVAILFVGLYTLNMGYLFDRTCRPLGSYSFLSPSLHGERAVEGYLRPVVTRNRFAGTWLAEVPVPLPAEFVQGIDTQRFDFERGIPSYLRGEWADHGWWYYYLFALTVKMPQGTWCLVFLAVFVTLFRMNCSASWRDEMILLVPFLMVLVVVSSQTGFSMNSRYVLPVLPLLFVWISKVGRLFESGRSLLPVAATLSITWLIISSLWVYPHCMSYFNELAGGPGNGARYLLASNLDCEQELYRLERWYEEHPQARPLRMAQPEKYPMKVTAIELGASPPRGPESFDSLDGILVGEFGPQPGWYALSVNEIFAESQRWSYFLEFDPVACAGYAIRIYHITLKEANRVRRELGQPLLPDDWRPGDTYAPPTEAAHAFVASIAEAAKARTSLEIPIHVALFRLDDDANEAATALKELLDEPENVECDFISAEEIRSNGLESCDVVVFPGGGGGTMARALTADGRHAVRAFVSRGGGYVGICGGAFLATAGYDWSLGLVNAKTLTGTITVPGQGEKSMAARGAGVVAMELTSLGEELLGERSGLLDVQFSSGPVLSPADVIDLPSYAPLAIYRSETWLYEEQRGTMIGTPAIVAAPFGQGRVILFSAHPETSEGLGVFVVTAIRAVAPGHPPEAARANSCFFACLRNEN